MPNYNIAGIKLTFNYQCDDFFKDNIERYLTRDTVMDYTMNVHIEDSIEPINGKPDIQFKNRFIFHKNHKIYIVIYDELNKVKQLIVHTNDYTHIDIFLARHQKDNLAELEYVITGLIFLELAILEKRLAFHGSAIAHKEQGLIFSAPSGTGKSTHKAYWMETFDDIKIINDDKPLIFKEDNQFYVAGSPWSGKDIENDNIKFPLKAIVFLNQGKIDMVKELTTKEKLNELLRNCIRPRNEKLMQDTLNILEDLIHEIPMVAYDATHNIKSVKTIYNYLFGGSYEDQT